MSIVSLIGTRIATSLGALALAGSVAGGAAVAAKDNPIRELRHELRDQTKDERAEIEELRKQLAQEYAKGEPDPMVLQRLHDAIQANEDEIEDMRMAAFVEMHQYLDERQRQKAAKRMAQGKKAKKAKKAKQAKKAKKARQGRRPDKAEKGKAQRPDEAERPERFERDERRRNPDGADGRPERRVKSKGKRKGKRKRKDKRA